MIKKQLVSLTLVVLYASVSCGQSSIFDLREFGSGESQPGEGVPVFCEDIESLVEGPIGGQTSANDNFWSDPVPSLTANVINDGGNLIIENANTNQIDAFQDIFQLDLDAGNIPLADNGFTLSMDYTMTDTDTQFYFTPIGIAQGFIFTRLGDSDLDGDWDVLETDGAGNGVFFDTGVPIALAGTITFDILDLAMDISIDGNVIYSGGIIGSNGDIGITPPEQLDVIDWESGNNVGTQSVLTVDNVSVNGGCVGGCNFELGDVNNDGMVDLLDVAPFVNALTNGDFICEADVNEDSAVDLLDVAPFVAILTGG